MFELLLDVTDRFLDLRNNSADSNHRIDAHTLAKSHRTLRDGSFGMTLSQALRARLRSHRPSGTKASRRSKRLHRSAYKPNPWVKTEYRPVRHPDPDRAVRAGQEGQTP
jgi:hypothetical protein